MFEKYGTQNKILKVVKGEHNSDRPDREMEEAISFLKRVYLRKSESKSKNDNLPAPQATRKRILSDSRIKIIDPNFEDQLLPTDRSRNDSFRGSTNPIALLNGS